jgi:glycosyltransferase involved in cell wall biosynthesis
MRLLFLVNGLPQSAAAIRAGEFAARLPAPWQIRVAYRPPRKWQGISLFCREAAAFRPDLIYVMDMAYSGVLAGLFSRRALGCRMVTDTGDLVYELLKSSGGYSRLQLALARRVEQAAIRRSDAIVVRGSVHQTLLEQQGVRRVAFVPDGVDTTAPPVAPCPAQRRLLGLTDSFVLGVIGTMTWSRRHQFCYGWDVIEALGYLRERNVSGVLVGDGDGRARLEARASELGVRDRAVFTGHLPYAQLPSTIALMDACVSTQSNDAVGQVRTTGKLPLYLACGKYVIATDVGEASRVLPGLGCLLPYTGVRDDAHPERLARHVETLLDDPKRIAVAERARACAAAHFAYTTLAQRVAHLCCDLVAGASTKVRRSESCV